MEAETHRIELLGGSDSATPAQAAAVVAALQRFMADTAPSAPAPQGSPDRWRQASLLEGVSREPHTVVPDSWINA
ncbi:MAG TPA: hypothetical protein VGP17_14135 [Solirubrobacteraceae bacterium]|jgi:hypothetical protein|nr:hypothetical protein [Solirubrobacteraceae bacterium]